MEVIRRRYVWALRVNVSDPSSWVTVFGPFECHVKPYANIVQKGIIFSMKSIIPFGVTSILLPSTLTNRGFMSLKMLPSSWKVLLSVMTFNEIRLL